MGTPIQPLTLKELKLFEGGTLQTEQDGIDLRIRIVSILQASSFTGGDFVVVGYEIPFEGSRSVRFQGSLTISCIFRDMHIEHDGYLTVYRTTFGQLATLIMGD